MIRPLFVATALVAAAAAALLPACSSQTTENCVTGSCSEGTGGTTSTSASGTTGTGAAGTTGTGGSTGTTGTGGSEPNAANCPATPQTGDFPCDVFKVIHTNCNPCHTTPPENGAPFPLLVYSNTQQLYTKGELVFQQMFISTGPNGAPRMPLGGMLDAADYATLHGWLGNCAPPVAAGTGCGCPGTGCN